MRKSRQTNAHLIDVDFRSSQPVYRQIAEQLRAMIMSGALENGMQLPPVREAAEMLDVNFNTVAKAYRQLDAEGLLLTRQGRGSFVAGLPLNTDRDLARRDALERVTSRFLGEVQQLGFSSDEVMETIKKHLA